MCVHGKAWTFDLAADPDELSPLTEEPPGPFLDYASEVDKAARSYGDGSLEVSEALRALGYLND